MTLSIITYYVIIFLGQHLKWFVILACGINFSNLFVFDFLSNNLPVSFTDMFKFNRDMPDARITRQSDLLHIDRCQSKFASSLPLYSLPIVWNRWVFVVSNHMSKIQFKKIIKLACINNYLSHVICNYSRCPDCYPSTSSTAN